jgi:hypothetical protein
VATLLQNGQALVAGGPTANGDLVASAELYNPAIGRWTATGSMTTGRYGHTATLLQNGQRQAQMRVVSQEDSRSLGGPSPGHI